MTTIEFIPETHTYLSNGVIVPSVSELIRFQFTDAYEGVPERILKKKADYGTKVHDHIERFVRGEFTLEELKKKRIDPDIKIAVENFEYLRKMWAFYIKDMEQIVTYKGRYCGTYDLLCEDDVLIDLKTTNILHEDWLAYQLGLYYMALGIERDFGFCIWLPKGKTAQVRQINVIKKDVLEQLINDYEKTNTAT